MSPDNAESYPPADPARESVGWLKVLVTAALMFVGIVILGGVAMLAIAVVIGVVLGSAP